MSDQDMSDLYRQILDDIAKGKGKKLIQVNLGLELYNELVTRLEKDVINLSDLIRALLKRYLG